MQFVEQTPKHFAERSDVLLNYPPTLFNAARRRRLVGSSLVIDGMISRYLANLCTLHKLKPAKTERYEQIGEVLGVSKGMIQPRPF